jgi:putative spermidine/putrescine transport system substrate-binding protein
VFAMPSGICKVKGGPNEAAADAFINAYLSPEIQTILVAKSFVLPTNPNATIPAGFVQTGDPFVPDWDNVNKNRAAWIERWNQVMA